MELTLMSGQSPNDNLRYQFHTFIPSVLVEIYLPKKAEYQATLYNTLTKGFKEDKVACHFNNKRNIEKINYFLKQFASEAKYIKEEKFKTDLPKYGLAGQASYVGYSMYEVDGVFYDREDKKIDEERTQIIRLIFQPDMSKIVNEQPGQDRKYHSLVSSYLGSPPYVRKKLLDDAKKKEKKIMLKIDRWRKQTAIFLFGFLMYNICERLEALGKGASSGKESDEEKKLPEDEIWVTTDWSLITNLIKPLKKKKENGNERPIEGIYSRSGA